MVSTKLPIANILHFYINIFSDYCFDAFAWSWSLPTLYLYTVPMTINPINIICIDICIDWVCLGYYWLYLELFITLCVIFRFRFGRVWSCYAARVELWKIIIIIIVRVIVWLFIRFFWSIALYYRFLTVLSWKCCDFWLASEFWCMRSFLNAVRDYILFWLLSFETLLVQSLINLTYTFLGILIPIPIAMTISIDHNIRPKRIFLIILINNSLPHMINLSIFILLIIIMLINKLLYSSSGQIIPIYFGFECTLLKLFLLLLFFVEECALF